MSLVLAGQSARANPFTELKELNEQKDAALKCETQGKWRQIHWRPTVEAAVADAQKVHKPVLVVLIVGKKAQKNATEC
jgi:hypothetical protein